MALTATVDRFEGERGEVAVLLVEPEQSPANVPRSNLPQEVSQGDVLRLQVRIDKEETEVRRQEIRERIERLKQRGSEP
ncbi:MAG: DUF3006 domain-containing protein [Rubrobacteraceae bacterium]